MTEPARPRLVVVWERLFVLEDAADEFYDEALDKYEAPLEVDRFDAHVVRVYLDCQALETHAQAIEAKHDPLGMESECRHCDHMLMAHEGFDVDFKCVAAGCDCPGFERKVTD